MFVYCLEEQVRYLGDYNENLKNDVTCLLKISDKARDTGTVEANNFIIFIMILNSGIIYVAFLSILSYSRPYTVSTSNKTEKFGDFIIFFRAFSKFYKNKKTFKHKFLKCSSFTKLPWGH